MFLCHRVVQASPEAHRSDSEFTDTFVTSAAPAYVHSPRWISLCDEYVNKTTLLQSVHTSALLTYGWTSWSFLILLEKLLINSIIKHFIMTIWTFKKFI